MTRTQKTILFFLGIAIVIMCGLVIKSTQTLWQKPLGPALALALPIATSTSSLPALDELPTAPTVEGLQPLPPGHPPTGTPAPTATPYQTTLCGGPPVLTLLAIGSDQRIDSYLYGLGDVIRLVRIDFTQPSVMIMSFPRDLYVEIPGISDHYGITHGKLNQSYLYGNPGFGYYDGPGLGPGLMARTLALNFGVHADNYIAVNMRTFTEIVEAVGGIYVTLPQTIDGRAADQPDRNDLVFSAGTHFLDGKQALQLARLRPNGTLDRTKAQNQVLCGLYDKIVSPSIVTNIPAIIHAFENNIQTDLSPAQISQLSCLGTQITGSNITFLNWPEDIFKGTRVNDSILGRTFILDVDFAVIRDYVSAFNLGQWPDSVAQASPETPSSSLRTFCE